jgi:hypothetical protein
MPLWQKVPNGMLNVLPNSGMKANEGKFAIHAQSMAGVKWQSATGSPAGALPTDKSTGMH